MAAVTGAILLAAAWPACAQLGSLNNPPPAHVYDFHGATAQPGTGPGTMAERRARLAQLRRGTTRGPATTR